MYFHTNYLFSESENFDYLSKGPLAGSLYYTKKKPGRWKNLMKSHVPTIEIKDNFLEITTPHEMRGYEHYIIKLMILDEKFLFRIIGFFYSLVQKIGYSNLQLQKMNVIPLVNKPYVNEVTWNAQNLY